MGGNLEIVEEGGSRELFAWIGRAEGGLIEGSAFALDLYEAALTEVDMGEEKVCCIVAHSLIQFRFLLSVGSHVHEIRLPR